MLGCEVRIGKLGPYLDVRVPWTGEIAEFAFKEKISGLVVGTSNADLGFVDDLPNLELLEFCQSGFQIDPLYKLKNLKHLIIHGPVKQAVNVAMFPVIERIEAASLKKLESLEDCLSLRTLCISSISQDDLERLVRVPTLTGLHLDSRNIRSLEMLRHHGLLRSLRLGGMSNLSDNNFCRHLGHLRHLVVQSCSGFNDLSALSGLSSLERLTLDGVGEIESLSPLLGIESLVSIVIVGNRKTRLRDDNLEGIWRLPNLKRLFVPGSKQVSWIHPDDDYPWYKKDPDVL